MTPFTFIHSKPRKKMLGSVQHPTATADWVVRGFPLAATPAPLEADVLLSCLDFIHSSLASSRE